MWLLLFVLAIKPQQPLQNDGFGVCPAFTHYHPTKSQAKAAGMVLTLEMMPETLDGLCHRDSDDSPIKERPKLPKPKLDPKQKWL